MIEDISIEEFYKLTKNINTNEKWEQILAMPDAYQKAHHLFSCSKYNKKVSSILFKFFQNKNLIKKTNSLHVDQIERLKKLPSHERNATIINISRVSSVYELAFLVNTFSDGMDIKTLRRLLDEKDGLKDLIEKPKFSSECLKKFYFGKDNIFADDHIIICSVKKFEYDMYREEILEIIKNLTPEEMLKFKKKATSWQNGIYQSYFESFLDDMLGTIDYLGEDFYIKLYETKVNKMRHKVLSFKSEEKRKIDLLLKMDFKHPVVFVSRQLDRKSVV